MNHLLRLGILLSIVVSVTVPKPLSSQDANSDGSVGEIRAVLESIHPYLPVKEVKSEIDIFGSTSMDSLAHGWAIGFKKFHPDAKVVISAEGSETVFDRLAKSPSSIGMISRPVTEEDLAELKNRGLQRPVAVMVAREALAVYVNDDNPMESVSYEQLATLFCSPDESAELTWAAVGVTEKFGEQPVVLLGRNADSGTQTFLRDFIFRGQAMRSAAANFQSNAKLVGEVQKNPSAIAISGLKCGSHGARPLHLRSNKSMIPCDDHSILFGNYPLTRPLTLVLDVGAKHGEHSVASREFVRYALSQAGQMQAIVAGFFPFDPPMLRAEMLKVDFEDQAGQAPQSRSDEDQNLRSTSKDPEGNFSR